MKFYDSVGPNPRVVRMFMAAGRRRKSAPNAGMWTRRVDLNICEHMGNGFASARA